MGRFLLMLMVWMVCLTRDVTSASFLNLSNQGLTDIPDRADSRRILHLNLSSNRITEINCEVLSTYTHVKLLDLSHNLIENIPSGCFRGLTSLKDLTLDGNPLIVLEYATFEGPPLKSLSLRNNALAAIDNEALRGIDAGVLVLMLGHNNLKYVPKATFEGVTSLRSVDLSYNQIEALPSTSLQASRSTIRTVDLRNNQLTSLHEDIFLGLEELREVFLWGNPLSNKQMMKFQVSSPNLTIYLCAGSCDLSRIPKVVLVSPTGSMEFDIGASNETGQVYDSVDVKFCDDKGEVVAINAESGSAMTRTYEYAPSDDKMGICSSATPGRYARSILLAALLVASLVACRLAGT